MPIQEELRKRWFLIAIAVVIGLAKLEPFIGAKGGPLRPEITVKYIVVTLIFFSSGLSLKTEDLTRALGQLRLHVFIQCYTLVFIPVAVTLLVKSLALTTDIDIGYLNGLHVVGCMPPPVSSAVILTKAVGGNEAAAIFNSAFGSFLGIAATPFLLFMLVGTPASVPFLSIFTGLSLTVVLPLILGQVVRPFIKEWLERVQPPFGEISRCFLLMIIYSTFCDSFINTESHISFTGLLTVIVIVLFCQCTFLSLAYILATVTGMFSKQDVIAILFCSTHKSLTLGVPILKIVFNGSEEFSQISLPLLVYHPTQILLGSALVPYLQNWLTNSEPLSKPPVVSSRSASPLNEQV